MCNVTLWQLTIKIKRKFMRDCKDTINLNLLSDIDRISSLCSASFNHYLMSTELQIIFIFSFPKSLFLLLTEGVMMDKFHKQENKFKLKYFWHTHSNFMHIYYFHVRTRTPFWINLKLDFLQQFNYLLNEHVGHNLRSYWLKW